MVLHSLQLINGSQVPVYRSRAGLYLNGQLTAIIPIGTAIPRPAPVAKYYPTEVVQLVRDYFERSAAQPEPEIALAFVDATGTHWHRQRDGRLKRGQPDWIELPDGIVTDDRA